MSRHRRSVMVRPATPFGQPPRFADLQARTPAPLASAAAVLGDETALYIAFWAAEPHLVGTLTTRDDLLFFENALKLFIDGGDSYHESEFNALGMIYEVFFIWRDADTRGSRWTYLDYDLPGLDLQVGVKGTDKDPTTLDQGWTAEITIPWASLTDLVQDRSVPPKNGDIRGMFFGRSPQMATRSPGTTATASWAAHSFGVADTHVPQCFTQVTFDRRNGGGQSSQVEWCAVRPVPTRGTCHGDPGVIRTRGLRFRKPSLYPAELRGRWRTVCRTVCESGQPCWVCVRPWTWAVTTPVAVSCVENATLATGPSHGRPWTTAVNGGNVWVKQAGSQ